VTNAGQLLHLVPLQVIAANFREVGKDVIHVVLAKIDDQIFTGHA
jgi:hypothetical protein